MRQAEEKTAQAGITDESLPREGCLTWKMAADRHLNYAWGVTCKHAAQKAGLRRYGKRARWAPQRKAPCRITAIAACGLIYTTPLGPVKLQRQTAPIVGQPKCWRIGFRPYWPSIAGELLSLVGELLTSPSSPTKPFTVGQL